jgi:hypothetical protein
LPTSIQAEASYSQGSVSRINPNRECHRDFPEWNDPGDSSTPICIPDILAALGKTEDEVAQVESGMSTQKALLSLLKV